jgi:hypothetical protein
MPSPLDLLEASTDQELGQSGGGSPLDQLEAQTDAELSGNPGQLATDTATAGPDRGFLGATADTFRAIPAGANAGRDDLVAMLARAFGDAPTADRVDAQTDRNLELAGADRGLPRYVAGAGRSIVPMVAGAPLGPIGALVPGVGVSLSQAAGSADEAGITGVDKLRHVFTQGAWEAVPELVAQKLGLGGAEQLLADAFRRGGESGLKLAVKELIKAQPQEVGTELVTSFGQAAEDKRAGVDQTDWSAEQAANIAVDTTLQTLLLTGAAGAPRVAMAALVDRAQGQEAPAQAQDYNRKRLVELGGDPGTLPPPASASAPVADPSALDQPLVAEQPQADPLAMVRELLQGITNAQAPAVPGQSAADAGPAKPPAAPIATPMAAGAKEVPVPAAPVAQGKPEPIQETAAPAPTGQPAVSSSIEKGIPNGQEDQGQAEAETLLKKPETGEWKPFPADSGTLGVPRDEMPQIKSEQRGALSNFLRSRGIEWSREDGVDPRTLKPTQAEFSPGKVEKARKFAEPSRAILVSADGHVVDGHHQWVASLHDGKPIDVVRLQAPIRDALAAVREFPSSTTAGGAAQTGGMIPKSIPEQSGTNSGTPNASITVGQRVRFTKGSKKGTEATVASITADGRPVLKTDDGKSLGGKFGITPDNLEVVNVDIQPAQAPAPVQSEGAAAVSTPNLDAGPGRVPGAAIPQPVAGVAGRPAEVLPAKPAPAEAVPVAEEKRAPAVANPKRSAGLRAMAEKARAAGNETLNRDRNTNTPKRQREAQSARIDGAMLLRAADLMEAHAKAIEAGSVPQVLDTEKTGLKFTKETYLKAARKRLDSRGYYDIHETDKWSDDGHVSAALRELATSPEQRRRDEARAKADSLRQKEEALRFTKIPGFFPTPPALADEVVSKANIKPGMRVLEPEGGKGDLAQRIEAAGGKVEVAETHSSLRDILEAKGFNLVGRDMMEIQPPAEGPAYDRIVMNPPFENGQDREHVRHAYDLLKPGGRLVAIMSPGPFQRSFKADKEFKAWADSVGAVVENNEQGSFAGKDAFRQTGVSTVTVTIDKKAETARPTVPARQDQAIVNLPLDKRGGGSLDSQIDRGLADERKRKQEADRQASAKTKANQELTRNIRERLSAVPDSALESMANKQGVSIAETRRRLNTEAGINPAMVERWLNASPIGLLTQDTNNGQRPGNPDSQVATPQGATGEPRREGDAPDPASRGSDGASEAPQRSEAAPGAGPQSALKQPAGSLGGDASSIEIPGGQPIPATYAVRELSELKASHTYEDGAPVPTPGYPAGLQPRDYRQGNDEDLKVKRQAGAFKPAYLISDHPDATSGPSVITQDGTVINGNSRVMTLQALTPAQMADYRTMLIKKSSAFGVNPDEVARMRQPVLVRQVAMQPDSQEAQRFARQGNVSATQAQSPVRTAASLGGLVNQETIDALDLGDDTTFSEAVNGPNGRAFRRQVLDVLPPTVRSTYFDETTGDLTDPGKMLMRDLLLTKVMPPDLIERTGEDRAALMRTIEATVPQLLRMQGMTAGEPVRKSLVEALNWLAAHPTVKKESDVAILIDASGKQIQQDLFGSQGEALSPEGRMLLSYILREGSAPRRFKAGLVSAIGGLDNKVNSFLADSLGKPQQIVADALGVQVSEGATFSQGEAKSIQADRLYDLADEGGRKLVVDERAANRRMAGFGRIVRGPDGWTFRGKNGVEVDIRQPTAEQLAASPNARGWFQTDPESGRPTIYLVPGNTGPFTLDHELVHAAVAAGVISRKELAALVRIGVKRGIADEVRKLGYRRQVLAEEIAAHVIEAMHSGRIKATTGFVERLLEWVRSLGEAMGIGQRSDLQIARDVASGRQWSQSAQDMTDAERMDSVLPAPGQSLAFRDLLRQWRRANGDRTPVPGSQEWKNLVLKAREIDARNGRRFSLAQDQTDERTPEHRMQDNQGAPEGIRQAQDRKEFMVSFRRHFQNLDPAENAEAIRILREYEARLDASAGEAAREINRFVEGLSVDQAQNFAKQIELADIVRQIEIGEFIGNDSQGRSPQDILVQVQAMLTETERAGGPEVAAAVAKRRAYQRQHTRKLVEAKLLDETALDDDRYFHRQVMAHMSNPFAGLIGNDQVRNRTRGFQRDRSGGTASDIPFFGENSRRDFNTAYHQAEFEYLSQSMQELAKVDVLAKIRQQFDRLPEVKAEAKARNRAAMDEWWQREVEAQGGAIDNPERGWDYPYRATMAINNANLADLAADSGGRWGGPFDHVWQKLANARMTWRGRNDSLEPADRDPWTFNHPEWWPALSWLVTRQDLKVSATKVNMAGRASAYEGTPSIHAGAILKAISEREQFTKKTLSEERLAGRGPGYQTWQSVAKELEGFAEWQPEKGLQLGQGYVLEDADVRAALVQAGVDPDAFAEHAPDVLPVGEAEARRGMVVYGKKPVWLIPEEIAAQLDDLEARTHKTPLQKRLELGMRTWKQWILMNPLSVVRYNINNAMGDLDVALTNPGTLREIARDNFALSRDLWNFTQNNPQDPETSAFFEAAERTGLIDSGVQVAELPDVDRIPGLGALFGKKPETINQRTRDLISRYFGTVQRFSRWREGLTRLGAARNFMQQISPERRRYAASRRDEMDQLYDDWGASIKRANRMEEAIARRREGEATEQELSDLAEAQARARELQASIAAKLARELIGDYGALSVSGQWLRRSLIPFWSWMEINLPRYVRLINNARYENGGGTSQAIGASLALTGGMALRMTALTAGVFAWNAAMKAALDIDDEEDPNKDADLSKMQIILGRDGDGKVYSIRVAGAMMDALGWFDGDATLRHIKDVTQGMREGKTAAALRDVAEDVGMAPVNRLASSVNPALKEGAAQATGRDWFPDVRKPRPIGNRLEHAAGAVGLGKVAQAATDKIPWWKAATGAVIAEADPRTAATYRIRDQVEGWASRNGVTLRSMGGEPTERSTALRQARAAFARGERERALRWMADYYDMGGKPANLGSSKAGMHPLSALNKSDWARFTASLDTQDRAALARAVSQWKDFWDQPNEGFRALAIQAWRERPARKPEP